MGCEMFHQKLKVKVKGTTNQYCGNKISTESSTSNTDSDAIHNQNGHTRQDTDAGVKDIVNFTLTLTLDHACAVDEECPSVLPPPGGEEQKHVAPSLFSNGSRMSSRSSSDLRMSVGSFCK